MGNLNAPAPRYRHVTASFFINLSPVIAIFFLLDPRVLQKVILKVFERLLAMFIEKWSLGIPCSPIFSDVY